MQLKSEINPANEADSLLGEQFFGDWSRAETNGWNLRRESRVLHRGQLILVPDFEANRISGQRVHLEIVGF